MAESLARHALFADVPADALDSLDDAIDVEEFDEGDWVLREGDENCGLHVVLEGEAGVVIDGEERAVDPRGHVLRRDLGAARRARRRRRLRADAASLRGDRP